MYDAIDNGMNFTPSVATRFPGRRDPAELAAIAPYLLGSPIPQGNLVLFGCQGHLPVFCMAITFGTGLDANVNDLLATWQRSGIDNLVAIGYCDPGEVTVTGTVGSALAEAFSVSSPFNAVLLRVDDDQAVWRWHEGPALGWEEADVNIDVRIAAMHAGYHAWEPLGVIDTLTPLQNRSASPSAASDRRPRRIDGPEHGRALVDHVMSEPGLPSITEAVELGAALLDCRVLEHAISKIICADDERLDMWFWCARRLGRGSHYMTGMAGLAVYRVNAGSRARQAWEYQMADTFDERTAALHDAIWDRETLRAILELVEQRRYECERPCCTNR